MLHRQLEDLERTGRKIRVGLVGAGQMGEGLVVMLEKMSGVEANVVVDAVPGRAVDALVSAGTPPSQVVETDDPDRAVSCHLRRMAGGDLQSLSGMVSPGGHRGGGNRNSRGGRPGGALRHRSGESTSSR